MSLNVQPMSPIVTGKLGDICSFHSNEVKKGDCIYLHPAPIPEGWLLALMDAVRRDGAKKTNAEILAAAPEYKE